MAHTIPDVVVLHEHPQWQQPLFDALARRAVSFRPFDVTRAAFSNIEAPHGLLYFNQASPSAYLRGNTRAVPLALAYMRTLELLGVRVLNGADVFALELSKSAQATLLRTLGIDCPRSITFNDVGGLRAYADEMTWPALLKPDQGGSGARIQVVESLAEIDAIFSRNPGNWLPDNLFLLQEYLPHDPDRGIVRLEFLGGELLYAMRVITHGRFNLCPSPVCNPDDGDGTCEMPEPVADGPAGRIRAVSRWCLGTPWKPPRGSFTRPVSTSAASSTSRRPRGGGSSTISTPTRTCARRWLPRSGSTRSSASSTSS
jgi:Glutathione synthase/Ribosomal protein S6 modification enzyme (glutaminyl transferase)